MCLASEFDGTLDRQKFMAIFLNNDLLQRDVGQVSAAINQPPDIVQIAELFEFLDEDRTGMISATDLMVALETAERLK